MNDLRDGITGQGHTRSGHAGSLQSMCPQLYRRKKMSINVKKRNCNEEFRKRVENMVIPGHFNLCFLKCTKTDIKKKSNCGV